MLGLHAVFANETNMPFLELPNEGQPPPTETIRPTDGVTLSFVRPPSSFPGRLLCFGCSASAWTCCKDVLTWTGGCAFGDAILPLPTAPQGRTVKKGAQRKVEGLSDMCKLDYAAYIKSKGHYEKLPYSQGVSASPIAEHRTARSLHRLFLQCSSRLPSSSMSESEVIATSFRTAAVCHFSSGEVTGIESEGTRRLQRQGEAMAPPGSLAKEALHPGRRCCQGILLSSTKSIRSSGPG